LPSLEQAPSLKFNSTIFVFSDRATGDDDNESDSEDDMLFVSLKLDENELEQSMLYKSDRPNSTQYIYKHNRTSINLE
jgi:hypothetical protein